MACEGATHVQGGDRGVTVEDANPKKPSQFGLHSATRVHEAGIASNADQHAAVYVPGPCTHRPSTMELVLPEGNSLTIGGN